MSENPAIDVIFKPFLARHASSAITGSNEMVFQDPPEFPTLPVSYSFAMQLQQNRDIGGFRAYKWYLDWL